MGGEPKKQEPEIMPPVPQVEPQRNVPEVPPDKDAPEKKSPIQAERQFAHNLAGDLKDAVRKGTE
jgi:hypothetical protein